MMIKSDKKIKAIKWW